MEYYPKQQIKNKIIEKKLLEQIKNSVVCVEVVILGDSMIEL